MAQRKKMANQAVVNNGEVDGLESIFKKSAAELAKLHYLSLNKKVAFDAGIKTSYERAYEWIQLQMKDGKPFTAADMCAYIQDKLSDNMLHTQQLLEQFQTANGQQQTQVSNDNATDSPCHDQEMETIS